MTAVAVAQGVDEAVVEEMARSVLVMRKDMTMAMVTTAMVMEAMTTTTMAMDTSPILHTEVDVAVGVVVAGAEDAAVVDVVLKTEVRPQPMVVAKEPATTATQMAVLPQLQKMVLITLRPWYKPRSVAEGAMDSVVEASSGEAEDVAAAESKLSA